VHGCGVLQDGLSADGCPVPAAGIRVQPARVLSAEGQVALGEGRGCNTQGSLCLGEIGQRKGKTGLLCGHELTSLVIQTGQNAIFNHIFGWQVKHDLSVFQYYRKSSMIMVQVNCTFIDLLMAN